MNKLKLVYALVLTLFINVVYAGNLPSVHQFINHKESSFVENKGCDGKFKGELVMEGVYLYIFDVTDIEGYHHYLNGTVTVLK